MQNPEELWTLSVVIPVYNESRTITELLNRICEVPIRKQIVLIDDASDDGTPALLEQLASNLKESGVDATVLTHSINRGKGASIRTGLVVVTGEITIIQDGDLEYDPAEYPKLIAPIQTGNADVVYGSRFLEVERSKNLMLRQWLGNRFLTWLSNRVTGLKLSDMETCFKVFRTKCILEIYSDLKEDRFGFEPEVTAAVAKRHLRVEEVAISYNARRFQEGKHIGWKDGIAAIACIIRNR